MQKKHIGHADEMLAAEELAEGYHIFRKASGEEYAYKYMKIELYDWRKEDKTVEVDDVGVIVLCGAVSV